jgi:hypothetical protein
MTTETQTIIIASSETYAQEDDMISATSEVLINSIEVDDVAMWEFIWETLQPESWSRDFSNNNTINVTRTYDAVHSDQVKAFYDTAKAAWEQAGFTVDITYT